MGEASVEEAGVAAGWEALGLDPARVGSVFAPIVERGCPTKCKLPATTGVALNVEQRWREDEIIR